VLAGPKPFGWCRKLLLIFSVQQISLGEAFIVVANEGSVSGSREFEKFDGFLSITLSCVSIPAIPISRSRRSRSLIPIDPISVARCA
jgi:hypothetical protein